MVLHLLPRNSGPFSSTKHALHHGTNAMMARLSAPVRASKAKTERLPSPTIILLRPALGFISCGDETDVGGPGSEVLQGLPFWSRLPARPSYISGHVLVKFAY